MKSYKIATVGLIAAAFLVAAAIAVPNSAFAANRIVEHHKLKEQLSKP